MKEESKDDIIRMLKTLKKSPFKNFNMAHLKVFQYASIRDLYNNVSRRIRILIRKGLKSDYITKEEKLKYLKGKLKIKEQIK